LILLTFLVDNIIRLFKVVCQLFLVVLQSTIILLCNVDLLSSVLFEDLVHDLSPLQHHVLGKVDTFISRGHIHLSYGGTHHGRQLLEYLSALVRCWSFIPTKFKCGVFHLTDQTTGTSNHTNFYTLSTSHDISSILRGKLALSEG
jgi:hypothetical protein